jgi:hypothetical protein
MDPQVQDRLDALDAKLDQLIAKVGAAEDILVRFLAGPGKALGKMLGMRG